MSLSLPIIDAVLDRRPKRKPHPEYGVGTWFTSRKSFAWVNYTVFRFRAAPRMRHFSPTRLNSTTLVRFCDV